MTYIPPQREGQADQPLVTWGLPPLSSAQYTLCLGHTLHTHTHVTHMHVILFIYLFKLFIYVVDFYPTQYSGLPGQVTHSIGSIIRITFQLHKIYTYADKYACMFSNSHITLHHTAYNCFQNVSVALFPHSYPTQNSPKIYPLEPHTYTNRVPTKPPPMRFPDVHSREMRPSAPRTHEREGRTMGSGAGGGHPGAKLPVSVQHRGSRYVDWSIHSCCPPIQCTGGFSVCTSRFISRLVKA